MLQKKFSSGVKSLSFHNCEPAFYILLHRLLDEAYVFVMNTGNMISRITRFCPWNICEGKRRIREGKRRREAKQRGREREIEEDRRKMVKMRKERKKEKERKEKKNGEEAT